MKFMIFTAGRTGSTNLMNVLSALPDIKIFSEPFSTVHNIACDVNEVGYIRQRLCELFDVYHGVKHCWGQLHREKNMTVLEVTKACGVKMLFLHRRNTVQRMVSLLLSQQSGVWHRHMLNTNVVFLPLDLDRLREMVQYEEQAVPFFRRCFNDVDLEYHELVYEDLFDVDKSLLEKFEMVDAALNYLGIPQRLATYEGAVSHFLGVDSKLSDEARYRRIPNLNDIMTVFKVNERLEPV